MRDWQRQKVASCESLRRQLLHFDPKPSLINADGAMLLEEEEEEKKASMLLPNKFRQSPPSETPLCSCHPRPRSGF